MKPPLSKLDLIRLYAVILDRATGELLEETAKEFREMVQKRAGRDWSRYRCPRLLQLAEQRTLSTDLRFGEKQLHPQGTWHI